MKTQQTIAIVSTTTGLMDALKAKLAERNPGAKIITVNKLSEAPVGAELGSLGMPAFVPGDRPVFIQGVGTNNVAQELRSQQWETIRSKESTIEEVLPQLGNVSQSLVFPPAALNRVKTELADTRANIAEAETPEGKLKAYQEGFNQLRALFVSTGVVVPESTTPESAE